ncbi:MAG TPA: EAL domain-containing protein [Rhodoferax sp.]|nr:EAL domain-containing protein [Rhodoferax sp.]
MSCANWLSDQIHRPSPCQQDKCTSRRVAHPLTEKRQIEIFKIEKTTTARLTVSSEEIGLAQAPVVIAHHLGMSRIAEGVETIAQHKLLLQIGCDFAQGYLYSKPVTAIEVETLFSQHTLLNLPF